MTRHIFRVSCPRFVVCLKKKDSPHGDLINGDESHGIESVKKSRGKEIQAGLL